MIKHKEETHSNTQPACWTKLLIVALGISFFMNVGIIWAIVKLSDNLNTPRIVMKGPEGIVLPMTSTTFFWRPEVASDFIKLFLPVLYNFSPEKTQADDAWSPFISLELLNSFKARFRLNQKLIESDDLHQTIAIYQVEYNPESESADVQAELRIINKFGDLTRTPMRVHVKFASVTNPLNPYGRMISAID